MKFSINQVYTNQKEDIFSLVTNFDALDDPNAFGARNKIKNIALAKIQPNKYKKGINRIVESILGLKINIFRYIFFIILKLLRM